MGVYSLRTYTINYQYRWSAYCLLQLRIRKCRNTEWGSNNSWNLNLNNGNVNNNNKNNQNRVRNGKEIKVR